MSELQPACDQTMQVYRAIAGELSASETDALAIHLQACDRCRATKAEIEGAQLPAFTPRRKPHRPRWAFRTAVAAAAAAMVAAFFLSPDGLRTKGGLDVELIVERGGKQIETTSYCPKDRLQVVLRSPESGQVHAYWIEGGEKRLLRDPVPIKAGERLVFPASFELDDSALPERLVLEVNGQTAELPIEKDCR